ncbi:UNVERIFIED_CONTAM: hypothetical protein RMT77_000937 [Armadillidium vulgare]
MIITKSYFTIHFFFSLQVSYISSCYGIFNNIYENLVNAQETFKDVASSLNIGIKTAVDTAKFIENFIDSTIEEDCIYKCPNENEKPVANPTYIPSENGCGSFGIYLEEKDLPRSEMVECCNEHDRCYDTCGLFKEDCDNKFKRCLYKTCEPLKTNKDIINLKYCQGGAKVLFTATIALGCSPYKEAQRRACICQPNKKFDKKYKRNNYEL